VRDRDTVGGLSAASNFYECFAATAERFASRRAVQVTTDGAPEAVSYGRLRELAEHAAGELAGRGVGPGDRCAVLAPNGIGWCASYLGILRLGAVAIPLDTSYGARPIARLLRDSRAKAVFAPPRLRGTIEEAAELAGPRPGVIALPEPSALGDSPARDLPPCRVARADPAVILYTAGTTSEPKGVVLTHGNLLAEIEALLAVLPVDERDVALGVMPLYHVLALVSNLLLPLACGGSVVFLDSVSPTRILRALGEDRITVLCCVPQFFHLAHGKILQDVAAWRWPGRIAFRALLRLNGALRARLRINAGALLFGAVHRRFGRDMRFLITGGARFDPRVERDLRALGLDVLVAYGLTETTGAATLVRPRDNRTGSVGRPVPGIEIRTLQPDATDRPGLRDGEVTIRGPIVMREYLDRPDLTAAILEEGWLRTGDLGRIDARGNLTITGRKKEVIVLSSGKNVHPEEIEAHYARSPYIAEVCVVGLASPDQAYSERLHAVIVPDLVVMRERNIVNMRDTLRFEVENLSMELPPHKRVLSFEVWSRELPRTTTRKLKRFEIEQSVSDARTPVTEPRRRAVGPDTEDAAWAADPAVARALEAIAASTGKPAATRPDANIELDLGLDSIERLDLITHLETVMGRRVPEVVVGQIYTVRDLVAAVTRPGAEAPEGGAPAPADAWDGLLRVPEPDEAALSYLAKPNRVVLGLVFLALASLRWTARALLRFRVTGRENLPARGPFLICCNHQSYLDGFLLLSALPFRIVRQTFLVGASRFHETWLLRRALRALNVIPIDPNRNLLRALRASAYGLRRGKILIVFPEGGLSLDGRIGSFKKGASILSAHLRVPIVPVGIRGTFDVWPRGRLPRRLARVSLRIGAPMPPPDPPTSTAPVDADAAYAIHAERLRAAIDRLCLVNEQGGR
jgi:long-chain acyl-CoA synthetase